MQMAAPQDAIGEVRAVERSDEDCGIREPQLRDDVVADAIGGGRRERVKGNARELVAEPTELPVLGAEVVSPLADAMRFVDRDEPDGCLPQEPAQPAVRNNPFWRDVEEPAAIVANRCEHFIALVRDECAVQVRRCHAVDAQAVDLILHQRDQRRYDDGDSLSLEFGMFVIAPGGFVVPVVASGFSRTNKGRRLKTETLAAARRQDDDAVAGRENGVHRLTLQRAEAGEAPEAVQDVPQDDVRGVSVGRTCAQRSHRRAAETRPQAPRTFREASSRADRR